jgi:hypothetical protein
MAWPFSPEKVAITTDAGTLEPVPPNNVLPHA